MIDPPPLTDRVFELGIDKQLSLSNIWKAFFQSMWQGDRGNGWTPAFTNLTEVGGPATITGGWYRISEKLRYFRARIVPVTNTSSVAATTYIRNFPLLAANVGVCHAVNENLNTIIGAGIIAADGRIYPPSWAAVAAPITITGFIEGV